MKVHGLRERWKANLVACLFVIIISGVSTSSTLKMADSRYLEAWKRNTPLPRKGRSSDAKAPSGPSYQVRLDTPGGVTYSPDQLSTHNQIKRLFAPYKVGERFGRSEDGDGEQREYDFDQDLQKLEERADSDNTGSMLSVPNSNGSDGNTISDAQAYAASIDMSTPATPSSANSSSQEKHSSIDDEKDETEPVEPSRYHDDGRSTSRKTTSGLSTKSTRSTKTAHLLASNTGSLPSWYIRPSTRANVMPFTVPPSKSGRATDFQTPWAGMKWQTHRSSERPSHTEKERGIAAFDDVSGAGRAPQAYERLDSDGKTVTRASTKAGATDSKHLLVADLFVIDPRPNRPLRMVRRTDPRQVLLLASGTMLNTSQIASQRAVLAAKDAGVDLSSLNLQDKDKAQKALEQFGSKGTSGQGGIGVLFSPHEEPLAQDLQGLDVDSRAEVNLCRRLEAPPTFVQTTIRRAQLRSVLAALELTRWEEEGFDKIVIGTDQEWILRGISNE